MIHTDGRPTIANAPIIDRDPGDETDRAPRPLIQDEGLRMLIDESELARQLTKARAEGYAEGFDAGHRFARELARLISRDGDHR